MSEEKTTQAPGFISQILEARVGRKTKYRLHAVERLATGTESPIPRQLQGCGARACAAPLHRGCAGSAKNLGAGPLLSLRLQREISVSTAYEAPNTTLDPGFVIASPGETIPSTVSRVALCVARSNSRSPPSLASVWVFSSYNTGILTLDPRASG